MFGALAFIAVATIRIPVVLFLHYEPKDTIIALAGFILGPLYSAAISVTVSLIEMFTISADGYIGAIMNVLSTCSFAVTASFIYKKRRNMSGAVIGLLTGIIFMTTLMLLWNYCLTPIYMGIERKTVAGMLIPYFLPFNLLKGGLNMAFTLLLYKPVVTALHKTGLLRKQPM